MLPAFDSGSLSGRSVFTPCRPCKVAKHHIKQKSPTHSCRATNRSSGGSTADAFKVLDVDRCSSRDEIRAAYLSKMKQLHPDVNPAGNTTAVAARVTVAYHELMQGFMDGSIDDLSDEDIFDTPEAEPDQIFINPFACNINPLEWRTLQEVAESCGEECETELLRQGVYMHSSAVCWLTPRQHMCVVADLTAMESSMNYEFTSWLVNDCLVRAARANNMLPVTWR